MALLAVNRILRIAGRRPETDLQPLIADFTDQSDEIYRWLQKFQQNGVPLTVIYPADRAQQPIVLTGIYTQSALLDELRRAIGSQPANTSAEVATTTDRR